MISRLISRLARTMNGGRSLLDNLAGRRAEQTNNRKITLGRFRNATGDGTSKNPGHYNPIIEQRRTEYRSKIAQWERRARNYETIADNLMDEIAQLKKGNVSMLEIARFNDQYERAKNSYEAAREEAAKWRAKLEATGIRQDVSPFRRVA